MRTRDDRSGMLISWAGYLAKAALQGALTGKPCNVSRIETIAGPRAGVLEIFAGLESGALLRVLSSNDCATLRQFVPWHFAGDPQAYMHGRYVRVEAGWPEGLADTVIRLDDIGQHPRDGGRWVAGRSETGATVIPGLSDATPHFLFSGQTGSGKSVALRSVVLQLSRDPDNAIALVDGKLGEGLKPVERLPGVIGPVATDGDQVRAVLGWACAEMRGRYEAGYHVGRVVVVFDEFQEFSNDPVIADLMRKLAAQGRAAGVHLLAGTQHPTVESFGDASTRRNLTGKVALRVSDPDASKVAVGGKRPRADRLLGAGDSYTLSPGACHRVQLVYVDERDITRGESGGPAWRYQRWPDYDPLDVGQELPDVGWVYTGAELAVSIVSAAYNEGRPSMVKRLQDAELGRPGSERAARLLQLGRDAHDWMHDNDFAVYHTACLPGNAQSEGGNGKIMPLTW